MKHAAVVPTDGRSPHLSGLLWNLGCPAVVIWTAFEPPHTWIPCKVIIDRSRPKNIGRWWNLGLSYLADHGYDIAVFLNDDVSVEKGDVEMLAQLGNHTMSMIAGVPQSGWAFALDIHSDLAFDEDYGWWFHETDLVERAERHGGVRRVEGTGIRHYKFRNAENQEMREAVIRDIETWQERHPHHKKIKGDPRSL